MSLTREEAAPLVDMLQDLGYKAAFDADMSCIESRMSGLAIIVFYDPGKSIQFYCGMTLGKNRTFGLKEANAANRKFRFAKFYLDDDDDLSLEMDSLFDASRECAREDLNAIIVLWEGALGLMKEELAAASQYAVKENADASREPESQ